MNAVNHNIRSSKIRVIKDGNQIGVMPKVEAIGYAVGFGLDLVEIAKQDGTSICLVVDYGKFKYEQSIKEKERKKKQVITDNKELWFSPNTEKHDIEVQINKLKEYLVKGCKVQLTIRSKPRKQQRHKDRWFEILDEVINSVADISEVVNKPSLSGNRLTALLAPKKKDVS